MYRNKKTPRQKKINIDKRANTIMHEIVTPPTHLQHEETYLKNNEELINNIETNVEK